MKLFEESIIIDFARPKFCVCVPDFIQLMACDKNVLAAL
jgi:hypothetical protein